MIRAVIFDSDGMLSHGPRFSESYAKARGIPLDLMTPFFSGPFKDCLVGKADLKEELQKGWLHKWGWQGSVDEFLAYWFSVGDVLDADVFVSVADIKAKGIPCVLATNQEKYRTEYLSSKFGYNDVFDKVFSSAYVGAKKPSEDFFDVVFNDLSLRLPELKKDEVLFWDDDMENIHGAALYGLEVRQYTDHSSYLEEMQKLGLL